MNISNSYELITIGITVRYLMNLRENDTVEPAISHLNSLKYSLKEAQMPVSLSAFEGFPEIQDIYSELEKLNPTDKIPIELSKKIRKQFEIIEDIIFSESRIKKIYYIAERRFNGDYLLNSPDKLLKDSIFGKLSDVAKFDFASACRCLALGEATASAFHILRATEDTLKNMYFYFKKTNRLTKPMWGPMTIELRNKNKPKPSETILNSLDLVRTSYRNPTQHPEAIYDLDSAQDLMGVCIDLINKMAENL